MNARWCVYYGDGSWAYSAHPIPIDNLIKVNVQVIKQEVPGDTIYVARHDFYWPSEEDDRWWGGDIFGLWDYLTLPGSKLVLFGRSIPGVEWSQVLEVSRRHTWAELAGSDG